YSLSPHLSPHPFFLFLTPPPPPSPLFPYTTLFRSASGVPPQRIGNAHPNIVPYQVFPVADGHIIIATGNDSQFAKLCAVLGEPKIAEEASYRANSDRLAHREQLIARLSALTARWRRAELLTKLESVGVPAG